MDIESPEVLKAIAEMFSKCSTVSPFKSPLLTVTQRETQLGTHIKECLDKLVVLGYMQNTGSSNYNTGSVSTGLLRTSLDKQSSGLIEQKEWNNTCSQGFMAEGIKGIIFRATGVYGHVPSSKLTEGRAALAKYISAKPSEQPEALDTLDKEILALGYSSLKEFNFINRMLQNVC